jgi:hypothetical protein
MMCAFGEWSLVVGAEAPALVREKTRPFSRDDWSSRLSRGLLVVATAVFIGPGPCLFRRWWLAYVLLVIVMGKEIEKER